MKPPRASRLRRSLGVALLGWLVALAGPARAHAPQARRAALTPDASAIAIALPGFGLLLRPGPERPFAYVCDALLAQKPSDVPAAMAFLPDGALLLGTMDGVRLLSSDGCPRSIAPSDLSVTKVVALAAQGGPAPVVYAASAGAKPGLWRSSDGGESWALRAPLSDAELVSALLLDSDDPQHVYLSRGTPAGHSTLLLSTDGAETFTSVDQDRGLTLLAVPKGGSGQFWALARDPAFTGQRGFDLLRAESLLGPWVVALQLNYFGGFAIDPQGVVWAGDEGGGLYRSDDGGSTFTEPDTDSALASLTYAGDALWACSPSSNRQPALVTRSNAQPALAKVVAFADVERMVDCGPDVDVDKRCAAAWVEWQRDVLQRDLSPHDAGLPAPLDGGPSGTVADADSADDAALAVAVPRDTGDASTPGAATPPDAQAISARPSSGCSVSAPARSEDSGAALWLALATSLSAVGALRRAGQRLRARLTLLDARPRDRGWRRRGVGPEAHPRLVRGQLGPSPDGQPCRGPS